MSVRNILTVTNGEIEFTTNSAVDFVTLSQVAAPNEFFPGQVINRFFPEGENIIIESIGIMYPYQFTWAEQPLLLTLERRNRALDPAIPITEIGEAGIIRIPWVNAMWEVNIEVPYDSVLDDDYFLQVATGGVTQGQVSMANMPANLDAKTFDVYPTMVIKSTLDMIA